MSICSSFWNKKKTQFINKKIIYVCVSVCTNLRPMHTVFKRENELSRNDILELYLLTGKVKYLRKETNLVPCAQKAPLKTMGAWKIAGFQNSDKAASDQSMVGAVFLQDGNCLVPLHFSERRKVWKMAWHLLDVKEGQCPGRVGYPVHRS